MKKNMSKLGFTLIELLIVIVIIGILAVVFLPSILNAPAKARDAARQADLGNIVKTIESARLAGKVDFNVAIVDDSDVEIGAPGCANVALADKQLLPFFGGGVIQTDPGKVGPSAGTCATNYYVMSTGVPGGFKYAIVAKVEIQTNANVDCTNIGTWAAPGAGDTTWCYGVRSQ